MTFQPPRVDFAVDAEAEQPADFGNDVSAVPDLDPLMTVRDGFMVVAEAFARRLMTPRGGLFYAPNYGRDVRQYLNAAIDVGTLSQMKSDMEHEAREDDRIQRCDVALSYDGKSTITGTCKLSTAAGPFTLTLGITAVSVDILAGAAL